MSLVTAATLGRIDEVKELLKQDPSLVNETNESGDTALHAATSKNFGDIVRVLLAAGANANARNRVGSTPLHKAAPTGQVYLVNLLLKAGADPKIQNDSGLYPEDIAASERVKEALLGERLVTFELEAPKGRHKMVIGKGGLQLQQIRQESGALIKVPPAEDKENNKITIRGRSESVEKAKALIEQCLREAELKIQVPLICIKRKKKNNFQLILLDMQSRSLFGRDIERDVMSRDKGFENESGESCVSLFPIPKESHKTIIGKGGHRLREIMEDFNVQVYVPPATDPSDTNIRVSGSSVDDVEKAVKHIIQISNRSKSSSHRSDASRKNSSTTERKSNRGGRVTKSNVKSNSTPNQK